MVWRRPFSAGANCAPGCTRTSAGTLKIDLCFQNFDQEVDGLPPGEGLFLPCSFWLADNLSLVGRSAEAEALFERLLGLRNDVGLLAEEYDPSARRQLGNFPQALSHVAVVNTARNLSRGGGPSEHRSRGMKDTPPAGVKPARHRKSSRRKS